MVDNSVTIGPLQQLIKMLESNQENLFRALARASTDQELKNYANSTADNVEQLIESIREKDMDLPELEKLIKIAKNNIRLIR